MILRFMTFIQRSERSLLNFSTQHICHSALTFYKKIKSVYHEKVGFRELYPDVTETFCICDFRLLLDK